MIDWLVLIPAIVSGIAVNRLVVRSRWYARYHAWVGRRMGMLP